MVKWGARVVGALIALTVVLSGVAVTDAADWPRYGGNDELTNNVPGERAGGISAATVSELGERWRVQLDGTVFASPLFAERVSVDGQPGKLVYAFTEAGSVYALRAGTGVRVWQRRLGTAGAESCADEGETAQPYGVTSTGVIDHSRNRLYVIGGSGLLYALDLGTGDTVPGWPVQITDRVDVEHVWSGLTLVGESLYVPIASYCDRPGRDGFFADGRIVAVDVDSARVTAGFDVVPGLGFLGGVWGYGGVSVDPLTGHLWTATGNSWVYDGDCDCIVETVGYGEAVVELDAALNVIGWHRPEEQPSVEDNDLGSTPLLFQPPDCPPLAAAQAKNGFVYVWRRDALAAGPIWSVRAGPADFANPFIGQPSYSPGLNTLFISDARDYTENGEIAHLDAVVAFAVGPGCSLPSRPTWTAPDLGRGPKSPPLVVDDVLFVPGGFYKGVYALDARDGRLLWSASLRGAGLAPIAYAGDKVLVADTTGVLHAFGLERRSSKRPLALD